MFSQGLKVVLLLEYAHLFCAGMLFFRIWQDGFRARRILLLGWCLLNQAAVRFRDFDWVPSPIWADFVVAGIFVIMFLVVTGRMTWLVNPFLLFLGSISYSLYLLHHEIGFAVMDSLRHHGFSRGFSLLSAASTALLLATLVSFFVEKPSMKLIRNRYAAFKARPPRKA
jgi:peptidoglycan/LPS O-acetylase OafA/YrhL